MSGWMVNTVLPRLLRRAADYDVLDAESPVTQKADAVSLPSVAGHVTFENVAVSYDEGASAIRDIDFEVQPGQVVALLGAPGSGKSTIAHVIPRFYDVSEGRVTIDGYDVRDVTLSSLRQNVGIAMQDVFVFAASIKDNIAYGMDDVEMEEVVTAAKVAQLHDFIQGLPDGYDSWGRRARYYTLRRSAPTPRHRQDDPPRSSGPHSRRLHFERRHGDRVQAPAGIGRGDKGKDDIRNRPQAINRAQC